MRASIAHARRGIVAAVALLAVSALTACGAPAPGSGGGGGDDAPTKVAFVSAQKAGDNGPTDDMIAALDRLKADEGVETKYVELSDPSTYESTLRNLGQAGTDIIVTAFPGMQAPVQAVAPEFPDSDFVLIFGDPFDPALDNAMSISYDVYQAMYVSGVAAAIATTSNKIGYVGGAPQPPLNANFHAFSDGARSVNPDIEISGAFVGSFDDPAKGRDVAASMLATGVDVIQSDAAAASAGVVNAAQASGALVISDSSGEVAAQYPETAIGVTYLRFGDSLYNAVKSILDGDFVSGPVSSGLADGVVGLQLSDAFLGGSSPAAAKVAAAKAQLEKVQQDIASGAITVTFDPSDI